LKQKKLCHPEIDFFCFTAARIDPFSPFGEKIDSPTQVSDSGILID